MTGESDRSPTDAGAEAGEAGDSFSGDELGRFEAEFLPNLPALMAMATRLTGRRAEAEDLVQDTLLKAYRSREQYRAGTNPRAWLLAILRNTFLNSHRRRTLERRVFDGPDAEALAPGWIGASSLRAMRDPQTGTLQNALEKPLQAAIDELPPEFKMTVVLADVEELSYREIAESLGCPIGTVMSRLHRGRRWLRTRLIDHAVALGLIEPGAGEVAGESAAPALATATPVNLGEYRQKKGAR